MISEFMKYYYSKKSNTFLLLQIQNQEDKGTITFFLTV
jgi:hypothetical protein